MSSAAIGIGAIILIGLWFSSFILCLLSLRTRHSIGPIVLVSTILITIILLSIPRSSVETPKPDIKIVDPLYVWRLATLSILSVSAAIGLAALFSSHVMSRKTVPQLKSWVL
ncbi:unnamed protein product [Macrosiphum euphorbiae]|uniref:Transmembrane protein 218 n=1 Tax=Macrosiphum euphorbiae TaxID=13131 RepID=A0AAV0W114_9HEMI|nr:unnamed protein product [Macrosiphum euphorbiae]